MQHACLGQIRNVHIRFSCDIAGELPVMRFFAFEHCPTPSLLDVDEESKDPFVNIL